MRPPRPSLRLEKPNAGGVIDPAPPNSRRRKPEEGEGGVFDELFDLDKEGDRLFAIDQTVIVGEGEIHHRADFHLAVHGDRALLDGVHAEDGGLGRIENGGGEEKVAVVPGDAFGPGGEGFVRCSYATWIS